MLCARVLLVGILLFALAPATLADAEKGCYEGTGADSLKTHGFSIRVFRHPRADQPHFLGECLAEIRDAAGKTMFSDEDHGLQILPISGTDINGDGEPEAVIEGYTGGVHCCWNYWIISLGKHPGLLAHLYNERPASFLRMENRQILIDTLDGRFDYFDGVSHTSSVFPRVFLRLSGKHLKEGNLEFWSAYLKDDEQVKKKLTSQELAEFRQTSLPTEIGSRKRVKKRKEKF